MKNIVVQRNTSGINTITRIIPSAICRPRRREINIGERFKYTSRQKRYKSSSINARLTAVCLCVWVSLRASNNYKLTSRAARYTVYGDPSRLLSSTRKGDWTRWEISSLVLNLAFHLVKLLLVMLEVYGVLFLVEAPLSRRGSRATDAFKPGQISGCVTWTGPGDTGSLGRGRGRGRGEGIKRVTWLFYSE